MVATGFARASRAILRHLHEQKHEVLEVGVGYTGGRHPFPWPVVSTSMNGGRLEGQDVAARAARDFEADALVLFMDVPDAAWAVLYQDKGGQPMSEESIEILDKRKFALCLYAPIDGCRADGTVPDGWSQLFQGINSFDAFAAPSRFGQKLMGEGAAWVPHGVDTEFWAPQDRERARVILGVPPDNFTILYVAVNKARKAVPAFFEAVAKFMDRQPEAKVTAIFVGDERNDPMQLPYHLQGLSDSYGLEKRGAIVYHVKDLTDEGLRRAYAGADILLHLSGSEGFGIPIIEAQSMRLPALVTAYSAMAELAPKAERDFCLIPPKALIPQPRNNMMYAWPDTDVAAERLEAFYREKGLRLRLRRAAWEFSRDFDLKRTSPMAERWLLDITEKTKAMGRRVRVEAV